MSKLNEGVALIAIGLPPERDGAAPFYRVGVNAKEITVAMESGHMAGVPWAHVVLADGSSLMVNLAHAESVELA